MRSNIALDKIMTIADKEEQEKAVNYELKRNFKPEFLIVEGSSVAFDVVDGEIAVEVSD